ncbi:MAG TPA: hypothetical protein VFR58_18700 [Flavisolibacter sp.]|nr:hypothetical protein [Flavisolibacter sp.]
MRIVYMLLLCAVFAGCQKGVDEAPRTFEGSFLLNRQIDTVGQVVDAAMPPKYTYTVTGGNKIVFKLKTIPQAGITDGLVQEVVFEQPLAVVNFLLEDSAALRQSKAWLQRECYGCWGGQFISQAKIEGQKISETVWHIKASVQSVNGPLNFEADFYRSN